MWKEDNKTKARKILEICKSGQYTITQDNKETTVNLTDIQPAEFILSDDLSKLVYKPAGGCEEIHITENSAITDLIDIHTKYPNSRIGLLNFASAFSPGGGFVTGAMAQEEALCHASTLYIQLKDCTELYKSNRKSTLDTYTDNMGLSRTQFIADAQGNFLAEPIVATVITSAAVNNNKISDKNSDRVKEIMRQRMHKIIMLAIRDHIDVLILGAFGCGVFGNDPYFVADTWKAQLDTYGGYFKAVYFSILHRNKSFTNHRAFNIVFGY